ncbi:heptosyltransferase-3 [Paraburkholderia sp. GAS199]|uniref:glycosyltransferase family 9 protein n=1 Tax=Paraburkholderia sp. GAS199 TaxID=3035126 RepID=UPI003D195E36
MTRDEVPFAQATASREPSAFTRRPAQQSIAFVMSPALGDTLNLLVIAHNLARAGRQVQVFGNHANALAAWLPGMSVAPALRASEARDVLARYATVVQMHRDRPCADLQEWHPGFIHLHDVEYAKNGECMAARFAAFAARHFGLRDVVVSNGMRAPAGLVFRRHSTRVALHPEASSDDKRWTRTRFVGLARHLARNGFEAQFTLETSEKPHWDSLGILHALPPLRHFADTSALAAWLYESGWFIGNDSGVGHLASSLGVPTLTVFRRRRIAQRWRPGFAAGAVVVPPWWIPTAGLKERWWRESISVRRVAAAFESLRSRVEATPESAAQIATQAAIRITPT